MSNLPWVFSCSLLSSVLFAFFFYLSVSSSLTVGIFLMNWLKIWSMPLTWDSSPSSMLMILQNCVFLVFQTSWMLLSFFFFYKFFPWAVQILCFYLEASIEPTLPLRFSTEFDFVLPMVFILYSFQLEFFLIFYCYTEFRFEILIVFIISFIHIFVFSWISVRSLNLSSLSALRRNLFVYGLFKLL